MKWIKTVFLGLGFFLCQHQDVIWAMASRPNPDPNAPAPPGWVSWFPLVFMIAVFYFLLIRPQTRQKRDRENMMKNLKKGDKIITQGGIYATIVNTVGDSFDVKINEDTKVKIQKSAVSTVVIDKKQIPQESKNGK